MMSAKLMFLVCFTLFMCYVQGEEEEGCLENGKLYKVGEKFPAPLGKCYISTCAGVDRITSLTCPAFTVPPESGCTITKTDYTKLYPDCCPRANCP